MDEWRKIDEPRVPFFFLSLKPDWCSIVDGRQGTALSAINPFFLLLTSFDNTASAFNVKP